jgi:hypothetical protein
LSGKAFDLTSDVCNVSVTGARFWHRWDQVSCVSAVESEPPLGSGRFGPDRLLPSGECQSAVDVEINVVNVVVMVKEWVRWSDAHIPAQSASAGVSDNAARKTSLRRPLEKIGLVLDQSIDVRRVLLEPFTERIAGLHVFLLYNVTVSLMLFGTLDGERLTPEVRCALIAYGSQ